MSDAVKVKFDFNGQMQALDAILAEATSTSRPAAHAGAIVLYDEVKANVAKLGRKTGNLDDSIYRVFSKDQSDEHRSTYHISWNYTKAPHGHLVEFGYMQTHKVYVGTDGNWYTSPEKLDQPKQVSAHPFVRPAFDSKRVEALLAARRRWVELNQHLLDELKS